MWLTFQSATVSGRNPRPSKILKALVVKPSPQHLSRGKVALSTTVTSWPSRCNVMAHAVPDGPAPTIRTFFATYLRLGERWAMWAVTPVRRIVM